MIRYCRFPAGIILFSFLSLLLVFRYAYAVLPLMAVGQAFLCVWLYIYGGTRWSLDRQDGVFLLAVMAFSGVWLWDVWRTGSWPVGEGNQGVGLPCWPLLAAVVMLAWRQIPPASDLWWRGLTFGATLAGGIAGYEHWWLGYQRADNGMNAIPFGNLALLMGVLSLVGALFLPAYRRKQRLALCLGAVGGLLASVFSGTRGGWLVLPVLMLIVILVMARQRWGLFQKRAAGLTGVLLIALLGLSIMPGALVQERLSAGARNLQEYVGGDAGSSLGVRLEMWRAGWYLIKAKPVLGWGEGRLEMQRDQWVKAGRFHSGISRYDQLHSDLVDTFARRGLPGLLSLLAFYGVPLGLFWRYWRRSGDEETRALALCGVLVVVGFIGFGLSQSMLRDVRGLSGYLGLIVGCWCLIKGRGCSVPGRG